MALSCMIGKISSPAFKAQSLQNLKNLLLRPSGAAYISQQQQYQTLTSKENQVKVLCIPNKYLQQSTPLVSLAKLFSTSSARLSGHKSHDHSKIWSFERLLSVVLLGVVPAALISPSKGLDTALALLMVLHAHFGLEAIVVDYVRPILFGDLAPKIGMGLLYLLSIVTLAGLMNLIYNDMGLANAILTVWKK